MEKQHNNVSDLESTSIKKLLWKYFLPSFAGVIIHSLYNIVDRIFIGRGVGDKALAGITSVFPIMVIIMGFGMLIGMGAGVRVSTNLGQKNLKRAEMVLGNAVFLVIILSIFLTVVGFLIKAPLLRIFGISPETFNYANDYLDIILIGTIFGMMGFALNSIIRSEGSAKVAMVSMIISAGLNLILDPIFIFGLNMGVKGAALATIISQLALMIWVLVHFMGKNSVIKLKIKNFKLDYKITYYIFAIGFAPFSMQLAASFVFGIYNTQLVKYGGDTAVGAMGVIFSVVMLILMTIMAVNMASQPIIGFNNGASNYKRVKETLTICLKVATFISIGGFAVVQLFPEPIVKLFNNESAEFIKYGVQGLRIFMLALPIVGFQIVISSYFQSVGKAGIATILTLLRQVIILIPILLTLPGFMGLKGIWAAGPISDVISGFICTIFIIWEYKRLNKKIELQV